MSERTIELRTAWDSVVGVPSPQTQAVFDDVVGRHRQAHRRYHGVRHVMWVVRHARALQSALGVGAGSGPGRVDRHGSHGRDGGYDDAAVVAAAFFHDAVYDAGRADNEERSAQLAERELAALGWSASRTALVGALVRATAGHFTDADTDDSDADAGGAGPGVLERQVLLDADLAVLGSEPAAYSDYATGVRAEHSHLADDAWAAGRGRVLRALLGRSRLYATAPARSWWDARARANLLAELAGLAAFGRISGSVSDEAGDAPGPG